MWCFARCSYRRSARNYKNRQVPPYTLSVARERSPPAAFVVSSLSPPNPVHRITAAMRVNALLALGAYAAIARADVADDLEDSAAEASSSVNSVVESVTSSVADKPTFTVGTTPWRCTCCTQC